MANSLFGNLQSYVGTNQLVSGYLITRPLSPLDKELKKGELIFVSVDFKLIGNFYISAAEILLDKGIENAIRVHHHMLVVQVQSTPGAPWRFLEHPDSLTLAEHNGLLPFRFHHGLLVPIWNEVRFIIHMLPLI